MLELTLINPRETAESEILDMIRKEPHLICDRIPQTEERCLVAVQQSGELLEFIAKGNQTYEMCMAAINNNVKTFAFTAKKLQTKEMCEAVLSKDGLLLEYVASELMCQELCNIAVNNNPHALRYVPYCYRSKSLIMSAVDTDYHVLKYINAYDPFWDDSITDVLTLNGLALEHVHGYKLRKTHCLTAVEQNPLALRFVPEKYLSQKMCDSAVKRNPMAIQYVPLIFKTEKLCKKAIASDLHVFEFIPDEYISEQLCKDAIAIDPKLFKFVPDHFKTGEMSKSVITAYPWLFGFVPPTLITADLCSFALKTDYRALRYVPHSLLNKNNYIEFHQYLVRIAEEDAEFAPDMRKFYAMTFSEWPEEIRNDKQIIELSRQLGLRSVVKKCYLSETQSFYVKERIPYMEPIENEFSCFDEFYNYLDGDLQNADLYHYDFFNIDLSKYSLIGANVNSKVLWENGLYDPSFYDLTVKGYTQNDVSSSELIPAEAVLHDTDIGGTISRTSRKLYYISDLHINHKLLEKFPDYATQYEIECAINDIVAKLLRTAQERNEDDYLLIAGDISFNFETARIFYSSLAQKWRNVILVLGNHELWNLQQNKSTVDHCVSQYRNLCNELGFVFLHNELLILDGNDFRHVISEYDLADASSNDLQAFRKKLINNNRLIVYGGLGFSGYNPDYNAQNGLYRSAIRTLEEDLAETCRFETIYNKLLDAMGDLPMIILTHTPMENWSKRIYNPNWIYVNGHTHRNHFFCNEEKTVYADNQIGYHNYGSIGLKFFYLQKSFDIFCDYPDGIYPISREQYLSFNKGMQIRMNFNRTDGQIHMLKRSGIYCFIYENEKNTYLLSGGALNKLGNRDLQYYYQRLPLYADVVNARFSYYYTLLDRVSQAVKRIGGSGNIHGSIVDISFFNHIFVNPEDFSITPYFALSTVQKIFYPNVQALLLEHCKDLHANYLALQGNQSKETMLLANLPNSSQISKATYVPDTGMYKLSKLVKRVQFLVDKKVVRVWDDNLLDDKKEMEEMLLMLES